MLLKSLFILLLLASPAWAMRTPILTSATPSTSATNYAGFNSAFVATNDNTVRSVLPYNGVFEGFYVSLTVAPGTGKSYTLTLEKNGSDTSLTCAVVDSATTCQFLGNLISSASDTVSVKSVPSGTPAASVAKISTIFNTGTGGPAVVLSSSNAVSPSNASAQVGAVLGPIAWNGLSAATFIPTAGTFSNLYVVLGAAPGTGGSGKSGLITIKKNNVDTALTCLVSETAVTCNDTSHSFSVIQTDFVTASYTPTSTPTSTTVVIGMTFTPTIDGESIQSFTYGGGVPSNSANSYAALINNTTNYTSESGAQRLIPIDGVFARKIYARAGGSVAPGSGKSFQYALRQNGSTSLLNCTNSGASQSSCTNNLSNVELAANDLVNFAIIPTGTPQGSTINDITCVLYIDPSDKIYGGTLYGASIY